MTALIKKNKIHRKTVFAEISCHSQILQSVMKVCVWSAFCKQWKCMLSIIYNNRSVNQRITIACIPKRLQSGLEQYNKWVKKTNRFPCEYKFVVQVHLSCVNLYNLFCLFYEMRISGPCAVSLGSGVCWLTHNLVGWTEKKLQQIM